MTVLYGIANCDTVKKARAWLAEAGVAADFVDFKKTPPDEAQIRGWLEQIPLAVLLNRRGTTWRKLNSEEQAAADHPQTAAALMAAHSSLIRRPVLQTADGRLHAGFDGETYRQLLGL
ncbi:Spx/MgsR family RNA polymerase-binding regulatory protein [Neisseria leonii]|uniref:Spx/MgsR family RNA polymerase-binding regulatory protein n=1 Tax=Neisseria leonii TaxID=2995413 RepID=UPI00237A3311|nr:Spx/MgsR family RNA polymerase-binding regulatory protein [Neisseria sp. 3986]MDD9325089.1 Spx/MgsR family RNA polymerase-binding regulatory protein [Neisseria sp. 3986]